MKIQFVIVCTLSFILFSSNIQSENRIEYFAETAANVSFCGTNAPYYHVANRQGLASIEPNNAYLRAAVYKKMTPGKRFDYGGAIDLVGALGHSSPFIVQQAYAEVQYRCLDLMVGSKEYWSEMKNPQLSSGGMVWSGNARPIPQVRLGIFDFTEFPWTNGWLQVKLDISFGRFTDDRYLRNEFGYNPNSFLTTKVYYHQKKLFFRSKESKPFIVTIGAEMAAQFGGEKLYYSNNEWHIEKVPVKASSFWNVLIPGKGDETSSMGDQAYFYGNHLGSWNAIFEYKFKNKSRLKGYFEWYFDDASGMGKLNGWDGLWGIEYNTNKKDFVSNIVFEYLQTTNQSGPIHWSPDDFPNSSIRDAHATGADDYYNNFFYAGWTHWGMTMGTPLLRSPAYNRDGYLRFTNNRVQAFHLGISGYFLQEWDYRILASYRRSWGTPFIPIPKVLYSTSAMLEITYTPLKLKGWSFLASCAFDIGTLYDSNSGFALRIRKTGSILTY
ncbi:MAG: capsule assembly Wzi family protein [Bacteroidales bacterium]|nr:capsule assembly Wzi family protein [Bacteroidales bacterium]